MKKIVSLFVIALMVMTVFLVSCTKTTEESFDTVEVVDESGALVGEAFRSTPSKYVMKTTPLVKPGLDLTKLDISNYPQKSFCLKSYTPTPLDCSPSWVSSASYYCQVPPMPTENYAILCPQNSGILSVGLYKYSCFSHTIIEKNCITGYHLTSPIYPNLFICEKDGYVAPTGNEASICGDSGAVLEEFSPGGSYCCHFPIK